MLKSIGPPFLSYKQARDVLGAHYAVTSGALDPAIVRHAPTFLRAGSAVLAHSAGHSATRLVCGPKFARERADLLCELGPAE